MVIARGPASAQRTAAAIRRRPIQASERPSPRILAARAAAWHAATEYHRLLALALLCGAYASFLACVLVARVPPYDPGRPVFSTLPWPFAASLLLATGAALAARSARLRLLGAASAAIFTVMPYALLMPLGHLHDSNRNLAASIATLAGQATGIYHDAYPGFWASVGLHENLSGLSPWDYLRWYPVTITAIYVALAGAVLHRVLLASGTSRSYARRAVPVALVVLFTVGPMIWMRNNLAPESWGFALGFLLVYMAVRRHDGLVFMGGFLACAAALVVSHPLSPLLLVPGVLAVLALRSRSLAAGVRQALLAPRSLVPVVLVLYAGWLLFESDWVFDHARRILIAALETEKEVTGLNRVLPNSSWVVILNVVFLALLALWATPLVARARRSATGRAVILWFLFMAPALAVSGGGRFFSRPLLFLMVPLALVSGHGFVSLARRPAFQAVVAALLLLTVAVGVPRMGYVESIDRPTGDEVDAYEFAARDGEPAYHSALGVYFTHDGKPLGNGSFLPSGGRGYDPAIATRYPLRVLSTLSLAFGYLENTNGWPMDAAAYLHIHEPRSSVVYSNGDVLLLRGVPSFYRTT